MEKKVDTTLLSQTFGKINDLNNNISTNLTNNNNKLLQQ